MLLLVGGDAFNFSVRFLFHSSMADDSPPTLRGVLRSGEGRLPPSGLLLPLLFRRRRSSGMVCYIFGLCYHISR